MGEYDEFYKLAAMDPRNIELDAKPKEPQFIVIGNDFLGDAIYYYGDSEIEAYRHYKRAKKQGSTKTNIYKAYVYTKYMLDTLWVERYEILETIK